MQQRARRHNLFDIFNRCNHNQFVSQYNQHRKHRRPKLRQLCQPFDQRNQIELVVQLVLVVHRHRVRFRHRQVLRVRFRHRQLHADQTVE